MRFGITSPIRQAAVEAGCEHISERVLEDRSELLPILAPELERGAGVIVELRFNLGRGLDTIVAVGHFQRKSTTSCVATGGTYLK
jgi:hypothetical protein